MNANPTLHLPGELDAAQLKRTNSIIEYLVYGHLDQRADIAELQEEPKCPPNEMGFGGMW